MRISEAPFIESMNIDPSKAYALRAINMAERGSVKELARLAAVMRHATGFPLFPDDSDLLFLGLLGYALCAEELGEDSCDLDRIMLRVSEYATPEARRRARRALALSLFIKVVERQPGSDVA